MDINLLKDGNGQYAKNLDFSSTWSVAHFIRFLSFAHVITQSKSKSILDVGFGDNVLVDFLQKANYTGSYHGIDLNETFITAAETSKLPPFPTTYEIKNIYDIKQKYDAIVLGEIIEHIPKSNGLSFLLKARSLLNENGLILLSTPNKQNGQKVWPKDHEDEYDLEELQNLCDEVGLKIDNCFGLWNNTSNTQDMLSEDEDERYCGLCEILPTSLVNVAFNIFNPLQSRLIVMILSLKPLPSEH
jgi:Methyltransferase domain